jgi:hypothetical protein
MAIAMTVYPGTSVTFDYTINSQGTVSPTAPTTYPTGDDIGYDSFVVLDRICLPSVTVFTTAFKDYAANFSALQQGDLANFILDIKNVP